MLDPTLAPLSWYPLLLCTNAQLLEYMDVFVNNFIVLAQGLTHRRHHVRRTLFHALDEVFLPLENLDPTQRKEVLSINKIDTGYCAWSTFQFLLGWGFYTVNVTMCLSTHQFAHLKDIFSIVPPPPLAGESQKWHQVLGELQSMALALPGSRGLLSHMKELMNHEMEKGLR